MIRLDKLLSSRGYCSRSEVKKYLKVNVVKSGDRELKRPDEKVDADTITVDGEPIDRGEGIILMMHKPCGLTCSHKDASGIVFDLLTKRLANRNPKIVSVGRLDKDTSGLLILTDDGQVVHKLTSPKQHVAKIYEVELAEDLKGTEAALFESGTLVLEDETEALRPAFMKILGPRKVHLTLYEGKYHQVRRMFAATGNKVETLKRLQIGKLELGDMEVGEFREIQLSDII